ncbi:MAG: TIGR03013 family XrtA/PEP-CTERM system glycosyltransferase [Burkholderiaceae bacterium]
MGAVVHYARGRFSMLPLAEGLVLVCSMLIGFELRLGEAIGVPLLHGLVFAGLMLLAMTAFGLYDDTLDEPFRVTVQRLLMAYIVSLVMLTVVFYFLPDAKVGRGVFAIASVVAVGGVLAVRWLAHKANFLNRPGRTVLIVGDQSDANELLAMLEANNEKLSSNIAGMVPLSNLVKSPSPEDIDLQPEHFSSEIEAQGITEIVVTSRDRRNGQVPMQLLLQLRLRGYKVRDLVSFYEQELGLIKIDHLRTSWLVFNNGFDQSISRALAKRAFDMIFSLGLLLIASPFMLLAALAILIETGRPILFRQTRCGEFSQPFEILKFRSMRQDAEKDGKPRWASRADERITPVGRFLRKTRIDELPQLFNVLAGDMSFVGPRPERPYFVGRLEEKIPYYGLRHNVKPGVTGWAQVRLPYGDTDEAAARKLEYDLYYVKNNSPAFDLIILLETIQVVLRAKGQ